MDAYIVGDSVPIFLMLKGARRGMGWGVGRNNTATGCRFSKEIDSFSDAGTSRYDVTLFALNNFSLLDG